MPTSPCLNNGVVTIFILFKDVWSVGLEHLFEPVGRNGSWKGSQRHQCHHHHHHHRHHRHHCNHYHHHCDHCRLHLIFIILHHYPLSSPCSSLSRSTSFRRFNKSSPDAETSSRPPQDYPVTGFQLISIVTILLSPSVSLSAKSFISNEDAQLVQIRLPWSFSSQTLKPHWFAVNVIMIFARSQHRDHDHLHSTSSARFGVGLMNRDTSSYRRLLSVQVPQRPPIDNIH